MNPTPLGEVIPTGNLPALVNEANTNLPMLTEPPAPDPWTDLMRAGWAFAMLPLVSWSAVMTSTLDAFKTPRH